MKTNFRDRTLLQPLQVMVESQDHIPLILHNGKLWHLYLSDRIRRILVHDKSNYGLDLVRCYNASFFNLLRKFSPIPPPVVPNIESSFSAEVHETNHYSEPYAELIIALLIDNYKGLSFFQPNMASNPRSIDYSFAIESQDSTNSLGLYVDAFL